MGVGNDPRYSSARTFETFPFPWAPGHEPKDSPLVNVIAEAARELVQKRDAWLNPPAQANRNSEPEHSRISITLALHGWWKCTAS